MTTFEACEANVSSRIGCLISPIWEQDQDGLLRSSTIDAIAAQVCCDGQSFQGGTVQ
jgi:hypothetical protein